MAKQKPAPEATEAEATEAAEVVKDRDYLIGKVTPVHEGHAEYIKERYGVDVPPEFIFAVYSTRVAYRKTSDQYTSAKSAREQARIDAEAAKEEAKAAKAKEREEAKAAKEAAKAEKAAAAAKAKAEKEAAAEAEKPVTTKASTEKPAATKTAAAKKATAKKKPF